MYHNYLAIYDNVKYLPPWFSDEVCKAVTGAGNSKRTLYTNDDDISWQDFEPGLPNVVISDLALNSTSDILRASTYGRGVFEIQLKSTMYMYFLKVGWFTTSIRIKR